MFLQTYFSLNKILFLFKPKTYRISSVGSILLEISHFSFLCQLKVLGHFAKNWFGKKIPVAVICKCVFHIFYAVFKLIEIKLLNIE